MGRSLPCAGGYRLGHPFDLDQAHTAISGNREFFLWRSEGGALEQVAATTYMVAIPRNRSAGLLASLNKSCALLNLHFLAVNGDLDFRGGSWCGCEGPPGGRAGDTTGDGLQAPQYPCPHHCAQ
jgi:hypothetical protein